MNVMLDYELVGPGSVSSLDYLQLLLLHQVEFIDRTKCAN